MSKFGDTPRFDSKSLCDSCRCSQVTTGLRLNDTRVFCRYGGQTVVMPQPVLTCSDYDDKRTPALWELEKVAWRLSVDLNRKQAGFISPLEWKQRVKDGQEVED